jgi:ribosomal protein L7/L12
MNEVMEILEAHVRSITGSQSNRLITVTIDGIHDNDTIREGRIDLVKRIKELSEGRGKIHAIKLFRVETGASLKDAKEFCESEEKHTSFINTGKYT